MRRLRPVILTLALSLSGGAVQAQDVITQPDWLHRPSARDLRGVWPTEALKKGLSGSAVIGCKVSAQGLLYDCTIVAEQPAGLGFGAAALLMAPQFVMRPMSKNGEPVAGGRIRIPIKFEGSGEAPISETRPMVRPTMAWEHAPTRAEVAAVYPDKAKAAGVAGVVGLQCGFSYQRTLSQCRVLTEEPKGYGFGRAAERVARQFVSAPMRPGGQPLSGASIQLSVAFTPALLKPDAEVAGKPNWAALPSQESLDKTFSGLPSAAADLRVVMRCTVEQGGSLTDCSTVSETPAGQGLGARALALTPEFRLSTWTMEGLPVVGSAVDIPLRYKTVEPRPPAKP